MEPFPKPLEITSEQSKLLESALRIKIMHMLADTPLTSKQVADRLHKTPGNVHYHMMKLYEGGLLELVRTETAGGIVQKFYRSKATWFNGPEFSGFQFTPENTVEHFTTRLTLSSEELALFRRDLMAFISSWESKVTHGGEYGLDIVLGRLQPENEEAHPEVSP
ncbi:transcriptional regulator [Paenibacillus sp. NFR01]|uniref:ArsR/SmtB family transcription factor n=1 Tax=Paenibacillus sp. NFR01 TaxID=1566279 RepID=UPI0008BA72DA|nr:winged helix-turn-helix domain-containing protein [Paenibacillus sp. NFR01]SEU25299.1 Helix-turn-helix domain-containing protein [Paenibacillus sp. NFR01]